MTFPLNIAFRNMQHSDAIEQLVSERAKRLERFSRDIIACRVVIELPHRRHQTGNLYNVRIDISVKGREIVIDRDHQDAWEHKEIQVAVKDAFEAAVRQLCNYEDLRRGA